MSSNKTFGGIKRSYHGMTGTSEHTTWSNIKQRCYNPKSTNYRNYGARGIKVCERWLSSFNNFIADMGTKPDSGYSIDRIDPNGDYEPSNCRWATRVEQNRNIRPRTEHPGVYWTKREQKYKAFVFIDGKNVCLGTFADINEAIKARKEGEEKYYKIAMPERTL